MSYKNVTTELAKAIGLNEKLFQLDFENLKPISEDSAIKRYDIQKINNQYVTSYQYFENIKEDWNCISLNIPIGILEEFIKILNSVLTNNGFGEIDIKKIPDKFEYQYENFNFIVGIKKGNYYHIDFAHKNLQ